MKRHFLLTESLLSNELLTSSRTRSFFGISRLISLLILLCSLSHSAIANAADPCQEADYNALRAIYLSTDGDNWLNNTNWPDKAYFDANPSYQSFIDISFWHGVTVNVDGYLTHLSLFTNNLTGTIPPEIGEFCYIEELNLRRNQLDGTIPMELWGLQDLAYINLSGNSGDNELTGSLPAAIGDLTELTYLNLAKNKFSGPIPAEMGQLTELTYLNLSGNTGDNQFSGALPTELCNLTNLTFLDVSNNVLTGTMHPCIGDLTQLTTLILGGNPNGNNLTGIIPPSFQNLVNLQRLQLQNNSLTGSMPAFLSGLTNLTDLKLLRNQLSGCYDTSLSGLCTQLASSSNTNTAISFGNSFDADWVDFCATSAGVCCTFPDFNPPIINCPVQQVVAVAAIGDCGATVTLDDSQVSATDDCGSTTIYCDYPPNNYFPVGTSTLVCEAYDIANNVSSQCTYQIIVQAAEVILDTPSITDVSCSGSSDGAIDITVLCGANPIFYNWSTGANTEDVSGLSAGSYTVTVVDNFGAGIITTFTVGELPDTEDPIINCPTQQVTAMAAIGDCGATVTLDASQISATDNCGTPTISCDYPPNNYFPVGTTTLVCQAIDDANNVSSQCTYQVIVQAAEVILDTPTITDVSCPGESNGAIDITVLCGASPLSYNWSTGANTEDISGLSAGSYTVTVVDNLGAGIVSTYTVVELPDTESPILNCPTQQVTAMAAIGDCGATVTLDASQISATDNCGTLTISCDYPPNNYFPVGITTLVCQATDAANNVSSQCTYQVIVQAAEVILDTPDITDVSCPSAVDGAIDITVLCGASPLSYNWSTGANTEDVSGLSAGSYTVTVVDNLGAGIVSTFTVGELPDTESPIINCPTQQVTAMAAIGDCGATVTLDASQISATDNCGTPTISCDYPPNNYFPVGTTILVCQAIDDANNVSSQCTYQVIVQAAEVILDSPTITDVSCNAGNDGAIDITVLCGASPLSYNWSTGANTEDVSGLTAGSYTVTVVDNLGAGKILNVVVQEPAANRYITGVIPDNLYKASQDIESDGTVTFNGNVEFEAGNSITLLSGFEVKLTAIFLAEIVACN